MNTRQLDLARHWLHSHPHGSVPLADRRERMAVLQAACDGLRPADFTLYMNSWHRMNGLADQMEAEHPALHYLRQATCQAMEEVWMTRVTSGMAIWHIYNMGYILKTPSVCIGIDLLSRDIERVANDLDVLLVSHAHADHTSPQLSRAMLNRRKPVVSADIEGSCIVRRPTTFPFPDTTIRVQIGDHHREQLNECDNMLMFEIDCGPAGGNALVYHAGDGNNIQKMNPSRRPDVFILHVSVGMSVPDAIRQLDPAITFVSHVLELSHDTHPPRAWRWSYDYAFNTVRGLPEDAVAVLTWGERWLLPGTRLG